MHPQAHKWGVSTLPISPSTPYETHGLVSCDGCLRSSPRHNPLHGEEASVLVESLSYVVTGEVRLLPSGGGLSGTRYGSLEVCQGDNCGLISFSIRHKYNTIIEERTTQWKLYSHTSVWTCSPSSDFGMFIVQEYKSALIDWQAIVISQILAMIESFPLLKIVSVGYAHPDL
jgi:hypothetical protein